MTNNQWSYLQINLTSMIKVHRLLTTIHVRISLNVSSLNNNFFNRIGVHQHPRLDIFETHHNNLWNYYMEHLVGSFTAVWLTECSKRLNGSFADSSIALTSPVLIQGDATKRGSTNTTHSDHKCSMIPLSITASLCQIYIPWQAT